MRLKRTGKDIWVGCQGYYEVEALYKLPSAKAFCKHCAREVCKPIAWVDFNAKLGIVVECEKCNERYVMYENRYIEYYLGRHTDYGFIPPTHGKDVPIPRGVMDKMKAASKKRFEETSENLAKTFGISREELEDMRVKWKAEDAAAHKQYEGEKADYAAKRQDKEIADKSTERKRLIEAGILVYKKGYGLVNTETGEIYKI